MSFILDALKKAESERSRASGPVLVDVRIAPPRRRLPAWAWALGGVLLANLVVLAWLMLRKPVAQEADAASAAPANAAAVAAAAPANATAPPPATSAPSASTPFTQPLASMPTAPAPSPDSSTTRAPGATPAEIANPPDPARLAGRWRLAATAVAEPARLRPERGVAFRDAERAAPHRGRVHARRHQGGGHHRTRCGCSMRAASGSCCRPAAEHCCFPGRAVTPRCTSACRSVPAPAWEIRATPAR